MKKRAKRRLFNYFIRYFRSILIRKFIIRKRNLRAGEEIEKKALIPLHRLTNFEIKEYYENETRFNGVHSRDN